MASGFVPVTGVAAAYAACCSVTDVCTNLLFNVAPSLAASKTIRLLFNCPVVWERVSKTKSTTALLHATVQLSKQTQQTAPLLLIHPIQSSTQPLLAQPFHAVAPD